MNIDHPTPGRSRAHPTHLTEIALPTLRAAEDLGARLTIIPKLRTRFSSFIICLVVVKHSNFQAIINFILDNGRCKDTGGVTLWQEMEERGVVEGQSWQEMKERFKRSIVKRLDLFGLDDQQEEQLRQGGMRGKD